MITLAFFVALFLVSAGVIFDPCKEYYEYVCRNFHHENIAELEPYIFLFDVYQGPRLTSEDIEAQPQLNEKKTIYDFIDPTIVFKWIVEIQTRRSSEFWKRLVEVQRTLADLSKMEQINIVEEQLMNIDIKRIIVFDMSLAYNIKTMKENNIPIKKHDRRYHFLFNAVRETMQETIQKNPELLYNEKQYLASLLLNSSVWFGFVDHTDVFYYEHAKLAYETEFKRLLSLTTSRNFAQNGDFLQKVLHIGAIEAAVKILKNYIKEHSERFIYQALISNTRPGGFNYELEIFIPLRHLVYIHAQNNLLNFGVVAYTLGHELTHSVFGNHALPFENKVINSEKQCIMDHMKTITAGRIQDANYSTSVTFREDVAHIEGFRAAFNVLKKWNASDHELRNMMVTSTNKVCAPPNISHSYNGAHSPPALLMDATFSQIPDFSRLYNCKPGDRLYKDHAQMCKVLGFQHVISND